MKITKSKLRSLVREALDTFQSHAHEPAVGDHVVNVNPSCKHHGSVGIVISINILPGNAGKTAEYQCMNQGPGWKKGENVTR